MILSKEKLFASVPEVKNTEAIRRQIKDIVYNNNSVIAVLDDDPTGIQTVHGINVYINMDKADIDSAVKNEKIFYIQTNTRGMIDTDCEKADRSLTEKLCAAASKYGKELHIISRGDSTLRGHYPLETDVIRRAFIECQSRDFDGEIIAPCFFEGGRYTYEDIHYVADGDILTPAGRTEFAKDTTFSYKNSDLKEYVKEKCGADAHSISIPLEMLRAQDVDGVEKILLNCKNYTRVILNAICYEDIEVFVLALLKAQTKGKRFLYRTAAAFVRVFGGIDYKEPLSHNDFMAITGGGKKGIVVVGSHVKKTTMQLNKLLTHPLCVPVELDANEMIKDTYLAELTKKRDITMDIYSGGKVPVVFTSRAVLSSDSKMDSLKLSTTISNRFTEFIDMLNITPDFFIAKGGITSSDMATKACRITKAKVEGQALPGIPVIKAGEDSRWPGLLYIIFPGNVGGESALYDAVQKILE